MDPASPKLLVPAMLFAALSPGLYPQSTTTNLSMVLIRAAILVIAYWTIVKVGLLKVSLTKADLIVPAILFILLSPGMLLTIPPGKFGGALTGAASSTSPSAIGVHSLVFALVFGLLRKTFSRYY
jgi:hypothetical protein